MTQRLGFDAEVTQRSRAHSLPNHALPGAPRSALAHATWWPGRLRCLPGLIAVLLVFHLAPAPSAAAQPATNQNQRPALSLLDAVRTTLARDPGIQLREQEVQFSRGLLQQAKGQFDSRLSSTVSQGLEQSGVRASTNGLNSGGFRRLSVDRTTVRASVDKLLRSGVEVSPGVQVTRVDDNLSGYDPENRAEVNFTVRVPLGRGLGVKDTGAEETAAKINQEAARLAFRNLVAARVLNTVANYWSYLAAAQRLEVLIKSEVHARDLVNKTLELVKAGEVPAAETNQLTANLADKITLRVVSDQELFEARQTLGLGMGLPADQLEGLALPADGFPPAGEEAPALSLQALISTALSRRTDLQSARLQENSTRTLRDAARYRLKPQVDLLLQVGYGGVAGGREAQRFVHSFSDNVEGVNAFAGLNLNWPPANNEARGILVQQESQHQQAMIRAEDLARNIVSGVAVAVERLRNVVQEVKRTELAAVQYETAVKSEELKRRLGLSTFINVLVLDDRWINTELAHLGAQFQHATALARLRYETGLLVSGDTTGESIRLEQLITAPTAPVRETPNTKP